MDMATVDQNGDPREYLADDAHDRLVHRYSFGWCGVMATVLHRITRWPVVGFYSWRAFDGVGRWDSRPDHVGVLNPKTGLYTDGTGAERTLDEFGAPYCTDRESFKVEQLSGQDFFVRHPFVYEACLLAHVERLLPTFHTLPAAARLRIATREVGFWPDKIDLNSYIPAKGGHRKIRVGLGQT